MAKIYMYHPNSAMFQEVDESRKETLMEGGYEPVDKHDMVAMFNPSTNHHRMMHRADVPAWEKRGYYSEPTVVYHPHLGPKTVSAVEAKELMKDGWADSPARFLKEDAESVVERAVKEFRDEKKTAKAKEA